MFPERDFFFPGEYFSRSEGYAELKNKIKNEPEFMRQLDDYLFVLGMFSE